MRTSFVALACLMVLGVAAVPADAVQIGVRGGLSLESDDGQHAFGVGGRIQSDWAFITESSDFPISIPDGTEFRRGRVDVEGRMYRLVFFKSSWEFSGGSAEPKDVYVGVSEVPLLQNLRVGTQHEPFSLEELSSSNHIVFTERSAAVGFAPSRNPGIRAHGTFGEGSGGGTWAVGVFRDDSEEGGIGESVGDAEYAETARITMTPVASEDGETLLHLGAAASHRKPPSDMSGYGFRPDIHISPRLISTGDFAAERAVLVGGEAALVSGPLSLQGELISASHSGPGDAPSPSFMSYYGFVSYFVTGEHRAYKSSSATFGRVKPSRNLGDGEGAFGALELAARVSRVDLDDPDEDIEGGVLTSVTLGANWYLNPNARVMMNVVRSTVEDVDGAVTALVTRFHVDF